MRTSYAIGGLLFITLSAWLACADQPPQTAPATKPAHSFPREWTGKWQGKCVANMPDGRGYSFPMELRILPTDDPQRYRWTLIYGPPSRLDIRGYELVIKDPDRGHYQIDEKNSIIIDAYLIDNALYSQFSVNDAFVTVTYRQVGDELHFELLSAKLDAAIETGGRDDTPPVKAYPIQVAQHATLKRAAEKDKSRPKDKD